MAEAEPPPPVANDGSRLIYVLWGVGLSFLVVLALVGLLIVKPTLKTQDIIQLVAEKKITEEEAVARLGGPEMAAVKLIFCLHHFDWFFWDRYRFEKWVAAVGLLGYCNASPSLATFKDRELGECLTRFAEAAEKKAHHEERCRDTTDFFDRKVSQEELERICGAYDEKITRFKEHAARYRQWAKLFEP